MEVFSTYYLVVGVLSLIVLGSIIDNFVYRLRTAKKMRNQEIKLDFLRSLTNPVGPELNLSLVSIMDLNVLRSFSNDIERYFLGKMKLWTSDELQSFLSKLNAIMDKGHEGRIFITIILKGVIRNMEPEVLAGFFIYSIAKKGKTFCRTGEGNIFVADAIKDWSPQGNKKVLYEHLEKGIREIGTEDAEINAHMMEEYSMILQLIGKGKD